MTAWQEIQLDWASKTKQDLVTVVLLWDLSAVFATLDCDGLCEKLVLFGVQPRSDTWQKIVTAGTENSNSKFKNPPPTPLRSFLAKTKSA